MLRVLSCLALVGCSSSPPVQRETHETSSGSEAPAQLEETGADRLLSADLPNPCSEGRVQLSNGRGQYPSSIGLETPSELELRPIAAADLDGDGQQELIAYILCMPGGSGTIDSVRAYHDVAGAMVEVATIEGGDRAEGGLDGGRIARGELIVGRYSGSETLCCPTHVTDETWHLVNDHFVRTHVGETGPVPR